MLIEKRDLEEAKQLKAARIEFVSLVGRFVGIRLYTIANSQELEGNFPTFNGIQK